MEAEEKRTNGQESMEAEEKRTNGQESMETEEKRTNGQESMETEEKRTNGQESMEAEEKRTNESGKRDRQECANAIQREDFQVAIAIHSKRLTAQALDTVSAEVFLLYTLLVLLEMTSLRCVLLVICTVTPIWASLVNFIVMIQQTSKKYSASDYNGYGCYCGLGGKGQPLDATDWCCRIHDGCYEVALVNKCYPYCDTYLHTVTNGQVTCLSAGACGKMACDCDRQAVLCFAANSNTFNPNYRNYPKDNCSESMTTKC
ncbi:neutral phospholipase A2 ammodytin I2-like [Ambystoma mexicanum]|uniref:neutral phospholipase A2 ammodytin I2-like n=1 Tax=Ambystoma mexicanum TaxID=8296 RepID=UPI0037E77F1E